MKEKNTDHSIVAAENLKDSVFFENVSQSYLDEIASTAIIMKAEKDDVIYTAGEENSAGIFLLLSGLVKLFRKGENTTLDSTEDIVEGETFNSLSLFYEKKRGETATASAYSRLLFIPKQTLLDLCDTQPEFNKILHDKTTLQFNRNKLRRILLHFYSDEVDQSILRKIMLTGEWITLKHNSKLFDEGEPSDSMFFLVRGFLKAFINSDGNLKEVGEIKEGEVIGEMGLLSDEPRSASIYSTRESILFKINKEKFDDLMRSSPSVLFALSKQIILRFKKNQNVDTGNENTTFLTLIYTSQDQKNQLSGNKIGKTLDTALGKIDSSYFLDRTLVNEKLGIKDINKELSLEEKYYPLDNLINNLGKDYKYIILECDPDNNMWTKWCTRIGDKFLFMLDPEDGINNSSMIREMDGIQKNTPKHLLVDRQLIIFHQNKNTFPTNTIKFLEELHPISNHYHIDINNEDDFNRLARILTGSSIGVAFGGGGARGIAHIGVYKALIEYGIPVDIVCGTSAGGMMSGLVASRYSIEEITEIFKNFGKNVKVKWADYTLPYSSIVKDPKLIEAYKSFCGEKKIEDLWLPMFCCAVNISSAELTVFDRGSLWRALRATTSLPGLLVPAVDNGSLFVDGGLINNMPGDILKERYNSKLISVNVSPEKDLVPNFSEFPNQTKYLLKKMFLRKKFKKDYGHIDIPNLASIMVRSIMVGSAKKTNEVAKISEIYLSPPTDNFKMLDYDNLEKITEVGYKYAVEELNKYDLNQIINS